MKTKEVLASLDPKNDNHWTEDNLPNMRLFSIGTTRKQVTDEAPDLTRESLAASLKKQVDPEPEPVDHLAKAIAAAEAAAADANDARAAHDTAGEWVMRSQKVASDATELVERLKPVTTNQTNIQVYLAKQTEIRAERAKRAAQVRAAGFKPGDLTPVAPIDAAMLRKTARGGQRPTRI